MSAGGYNMTAEAFSTQLAVHEADDADLAIRSTTSAVSNDAVSLVERIARVLSRTSVIGEARDALAAAGWTATIAGNRITVEEGVLAQLIPAKIGTFGLVSAHWVIYSAAGTQPTWIVGVETSSSSG
jgi:hypothetical protein